MQELFLGLSAKNHDRVTRCKINTFEDENTNIMSARLQRLRRQFDRLEKQKSALMTLILQMPADQYMQQPDSATWSVAQAANHIYLSEKLSMGYLHKKLSYPDTVPTYSLKSIGGMLLLKMALRTPYKVKAPKMINMWDQQPILSQEELSASWAALRKDMILYLEEQLPRFPNHLVYRHPFAGRFTIIQTVIFFHEHLTHHLRQIRRIIHSLESPPT